MLVESPQRYRRVAETAPSTLAGPLPLPGPRQATAATVRTALTHRPLCSQRAIRERCFGGPAGFENESTSKALAAASINDSSIRSDERNPCERFVPEEVGQPSGTRFARVATRAACGRCGRPSAGGMPARRVRWAWEGSAAAWSTNEAAFPKSARSLYRPWRPTCKMESTPTFWTTYCRPS